MQKKQSGTDGPTDRPIDTMAYRSRARNKNEFKACTVEPRYTGPKSNGNPPITNSKPWSLPVISFNFLYWQQRKSANNRWYLLVPWLPVLWGATVLLFWYQAICCDHNIALDACSAYLTRHLSYSVMPHMVDLDMKNKKWCEELLSAGWQGQQCADYKP